MSASATTINDTLAFLDALAAQPGRTPKRHQGGRSSVLGPLLHGLYGKGSPKRRQFVFKLLLKVEGADLYSLTARRIAADFHKLEVGLYSDCSLPLFGRFQRPARIAPYASIASTAAALPAPESPALEIGPDVWLGHNVQIQPGVRSIGAGAVVGANSQVLRDVPPYAIVVGNPGRVVRYRFTPPLIARLLASRWWELSIEELRPHFLHFQRPLEGNQIR